MTATKRPPLSSRAWFGMTLNGFLEDGNHGVTFDDVYDGIDNGTLFDVLKAKVPHMDVGWWTGTPNGPAIIAAVRDAAAGMREREEKKYGVAKGGLSLLLAYVLEAVQQNYWES